MMFILLFEKIDEFETKMQAQAHAIAQDAQLLDILNAAKDMIAGAD
jgi:hypothetical protein